MLKQITSPNNPLIKNILTLQKKSSERRNQGIFILEGVREIGLAIAGGYPFTHLLFRTDIFDKESLTQWAIPNTECIEISERVYKKIALRTTTEGIIGIAKTKDLSLSALELKNKNPLVLVAEAPEKPGNIGALLRTADAANLDAVIIANPKTDMFNPNIVRSSVGCLFTVPIATGKTSEIIRFLKQQEIKIYGAALSASEIYHQPDYNQATAIVVGTEATGLSKEWLSNTDKNVIIPMEGKIDSLNVSVSAAILIFEAKKQRSG